MVRACDETFGRVDCLVNAAALTDRGTILDTTPELFERMFRVNTEAPFFLMQDAIRVMKREQIEGAIVNILSVSAHGGQSFLAAYAASKMALGTLTKNTAFAVLPDRIRVNGLNIGWMDTPGEQSIQKRAHDAPDDWLPKAEAARPFGRLLKPTEVARAVAFLCSAESGMMTGSLVDFDQTVLGCWEDAPFPAAASLERPAGPCRHARSPASVTDVILLPMHLVHLSSVAGAAGAARPRGAGRSVREFMVQLMMMLLGGTMGDAGGPAMTGKVHLGEFVLSPEAAAAEVGRAYGFVLEPAQAGLSLAALLGRELGTRVAVGERLALGPIELVVRSLDDRGVVQAVGLALEPEVA